MQTAQQLRHTNIAEYILYLWQLEDLFRSLQFSPQAIFTQFVAPRPDITQGDAEVLHNWYMEFCEMLEREGKRTQGHSEHTLHLIADLNDLHLRLLKLPVGARYQTLWQGMEGALDDLRAAMKSETPISDIELSFRALYGAMLYRLKGEDGRGAVEDTLAYVSPLIAELASMYGKVERGEVDLFKENN